MARIVYGVSGEGSGHSSRARVIAPYLIEKGHTVKLVSYDRGYQNLKDDFEVFETEGLHISSADNRVSVVKTFTENLQRLPQGHKKLQKLRKQFFKEFRPHCVITDFEPMTAYQANLFDVPLITLDNQHRLRYMDYPCPWEMKGDQLLTENIIRTMIPRPDVSLVTTFYFGKAKNRRTFFFPPILRNEVLALQPQEGNHVLVYLTDGFETLLELLKEFKQDIFLVYGYDKEGQKDNIIFKPRSRNTFLHDLATCKAVIATAGFTLITEALSLSKPYLALPMKGQFEQEINTLLLSELNYGIGTTKLKPETIGYFLYQLPKFKKQIQEYPSSNNQAIQIKLDELLADNCALAHAYHNKRVNELIDFISPL
jgi:uncharacterized protein (TIGR00661 family)